MRGEGHSDEGGLPGAAASQPHHESLEAGEQACNDKQCFWYVQTLSPYTTSSTLQALADMVPCRSRIVIFTSTLETI